jgi:hypothetical protein
MSKTHFKKLRNPNYLGSWDLMDDDGKIHNKILTITDVKKDTVFDGTGKQEECVVVFFKNVKPMIMNSTNLKTISKILQSPFIEDWIGNALEVTVKKIKAFGEFHDALRISPKKVTEDANSNKVDVDKCIKILDASTTILELQSNWSKLSHEEQKNQMVISKKDDLKSILK